MTGTRIEINLDRIEHNARTLREQYAGRGIGITAVTKGVCGDPAIARAIVRGGIRSLGDSRLENLRRMRLAGVDAEFMLLRPPRPSRVAQVVALADISLNTELEVVRLLAAHARAAGRMHGVILMVEGGDLREGIMPRNLPEIVEQVATLKGVRLRGIGTNLVCLNGVVPTDEVMGAFSRLVDNLERDLDITLPVVSGGNSGNHNWVMSTERVGRVNHLRIGEAILLGHESTRRQRIEGLASDAFTVIGEVVEVKDKPSRPRGEQALNALGRRPEREDLGTIRRAIVALGEQDVALNALRPRINARIVGMCSDQLVLYDRGATLQVGDAVAFDVAYGTLMRAMTSPYMEKCYLRHGEAVAIAPVMAAAKV